MSATTKLQAVPTEPAPASDPLARLREPFPAHHISKLPKPTKAQTDAVRADFKKGIRCGACGSWHHPDVAHLDYVGHAALTDRLLDVDPHWSWEPAAFRDGLPAFDATGGLWIKLTVCGVSRFGYGHAATKPGMDPGVREKEVIGDALRNAAMRFGAALDLWHKGDLHATDADSEDTADAPQTPTPSTRSSAPSLAERASKLEAALKSLKTSAEIDKAMKLASGLLADLDAKDPERLAEIDKLAEGRRTEIAGTGFGIGDDEIPF